MIEYLFDFLDSLQRFLAKTNAKEIIKREPNKFDLNKNMPPSFLVSKEDVEKFDEID